MLDRFHPDRLRRVLQCIDDLLAEARAAAHGRAATIDGTALEQRTSARNLAHYLAVRTHDLRPLQRELADLSLSSLGRMEANVEHTLQGVQLALLGLLGELPAVPAMAGRLTADAATQLLDHHAVELLGPSPARRRTRIMVTLPSAAMSDRALLHELLLAGMDLVRVNLAHDGPAAWSAMVANLPVIWATQVLDSMARTGVPSRAEVTDAAMAVRAECVMLNKGPYIVETARFLGGVLERMQEHHVKKRSMLRALRVAGAPDAQRL